MYIKKFAIEFGTVLANITRDCRRRDISVERHRAWRKHRGLGDLIQARDHVWDHPNLGKVTGK